MYSIGSCPSYFTPSVVDQQKEEKIDQLIGGCFVNEEDVDTAFEIAKTMESSVSLHFMLSDVSNAYLKLKTEKGCGKSYKVAQYKENQRADVRKLFDSIIETCLQIKSPESIGLAEEIYENHSECLAFSAHKIEFNIIKDQLERNHQLEIE